MAVNFPDSPSNGDTHTVGTTVYTYNSTLGVWQGGGAGSKVDVQETQPSNPDTGDMWFKDSIKTFHIYDGNDWESLKFNFPPTITNVSPASYVGASGTDFTVTGTNFTSGGVAKFITADGTEYTSSATSITSKTSLTMRTPQAFLEADGPLDIKLIMLGDLDVTASNVISTGAGPVWTTAAGRLSTNADDAPNNAYLLGGTYNETVVATDADGDTLSYSLASGSLPPGASLNTTTGAITGTAPATHPASADTTYTFTIAVTDSVNSISRQFNILLRNVTGALYDFTSHTFTNAGGSIQTGPTQAQMRSTYSSQTWAQTYVSQGTYQGYQDWTVPKNGNYKLLAAGSRATTKDTSAGRGIIIEIASVALVKDEIITIAVGQMGAGGFPTSAPGGGGTFIVRKNGNVPLLIAGGGGGYYSVSSGVGGQQDGRNSTTGGTGGTGAGGTNGYGGQATGSSPYGGGGGGFLGDGTDAANNSNSGGHGFQSGLAGGASNNGYSYAGGGFGGGGGTHGNSGGGAGGGGYSGGGGSGHNGGTSGGGGGSYGISAYSVIGYNNNHGYATITLL